MPLSSIVSDFRRSSKGGAFAIELQMAAVDVVCQLMATEARPSKVALLLQFNGFTVQENGFENGLPQDSLTADGL
ncbi:hypothetical protein ACLKA6_019337 [Drosophila palustris]